MKFKNSFLTISLFIIILSVFLNGCRIMNRYTIDEVKNYGKDLEKEEKTIFIKGKVNIIVDLTVSKKDSIIEKIKDLVKITASKLIEDIKKLFKVNLPEIRKIFILKDGDESIICVTSSNKINDNDIVVLKGKVNTLLMINSPEFLKTIFSKWNSVFTDDEGKINLILFETEEPVSKSIFGRAWFFMLRYFWIILIIIGVIVIGILIYLYINNIIKF